MTDAPAYRLSRAFGIPKRLIGFSGAAPRLRDTEPWPACALCGTPMVCFFDLTLPDDAGPFAAGSTLQVMQCPEHDDLPGTPYSGIVPFLDATAGDGLPDRFWELSDGHYQMRLLPAGEPLSPAEGVETRTEPMHVSATPLRQRDAPGLKGLGTPAWIQGDESRTCSCGAPMALVLQVPEHFFPTPGLQSPPGPAQHHLLFNGNAVFVLACTAQHHPQALWAVVQN